MEQIKQRDYMFDTFRGLLMWSIPISHFTRVAGHFSAGSLSGIVYITINVFVMQAFVFLSGYFSKKPDRARQSSFHTFLWPYLLCIPFFYMVRLIIWGHATLDLLIPPFALWYLFALFFYRFFLKDYIKIPHIFEISMVIYLCTGLIPFFSDIFALGRMFSYFPFFLLGYYCTPDHLRKLRSLKKWHCLLLAIVLIGISCVLAFYGNQFPVGYYLLKNPCYDLGITWYWDILGRMIIFVLACGWIILMINILPNKKNYLAYVGMNTMPIYILHLIVRYLVKKYSINFGLFPDNVIVYYISIFALASLCAIIFSSKPVVKAYDFVVEGLYKVFTWLLNKFAILMKKVHVPVISLANWVVETIYLAGGTEDSRKHKREIRMKKRNEQKENSSSEDENAEDENPSDTKEKDDSEINGNIYFHYSGEEELDSISVEEIRNYSLNKNKENDIEKDMVQDNVLKSSTAEGEQDNHTYEEVHSMTENESESISNQEVDSTENEISTEYESELNENAEKEVEVKANIESETKNTAETAFAPEKDETPTVSEPKVHLKPRGFVADKRDKSKPDLNNNSNEKFHLRPRGSVDDKEYNSASEMNKKLATAKDE